MNIIRSIACIWLLIIYADVRGQSADACCSCMEPARSAPAGIIIDHVHTKKDWMLSYRYMFMQMKDNQRGRTKLSSDQVFNDYIMSPARMTMQMHMLMLMYGLSDRITLMGMSSYAVNSMNMSMMEYGSHTHSGTGHDHTESFSENSGLTDSRIYALYELSATNGHEIVLSAGLSIPTGRTSLSGTSMFGGQNRLAYLMQPGTGSFALLPGIVYTWQRPKMSGGAQLNIALRTGRTNVSYQWGNELNMGGWISHNWSRRFSGSLRSDLAISGRISGYDPEIALLSGIDPMADVNNYGGSRANIYGGLNMIFPSGALQGLKISAEFGLPFYQNLNGIQMTLKSTLYTNIQYGF